MDDTDPTTKDGARPGAGLSRRAALLVTGSLVAAGSVAAASVASARRGTTTLHAAPTAPAAPASPGAPAAPSTPDAPAAAGAPVPAIRLRPDWGPKLKPKRQLEAERRSDVRFLLVHHTASSNGYRESEVPGLLRQFYDLHTGKGWGWPDIAYNFVVDRFGGVWEGRLGSATRPMKADATGGSQGFALLCCFLGHHSEVAPTAAARTAMTGLLAWLADTYRIDTRPGAKTSFVSRGSNRWPAGAKVTTATIAGHRDMSNTDCPGDAAYHLVREVFPAAVTALRGGTAPARGPSAPGATPPASR